MSKRQNTGLAGTNAFFQPPPQVQETPAEQTESASIPKATVSQKSKKTKPEKMVTSLRILTSTMAKIQAIKIHELEQGNRVNNGDILDEAIIDLFQKKGLNKDA